MPGHSAEHEHRRTQIFYALKNLSGTYQQNLPAYYVAFLEMWFGSESILSDYTLIRHGGSIEELLPFDLTTSLTKLDSLQDSKKLEQFLTELKLYTDTHQQPLKNNRSEIHDIDLMCNAPTDSLKAVFGPDNVRESRIALYYGCRLVTIKFHHENKDYIFDMTLYEPVDENPLPPHLNLYIYEKVSKNPKRTGDQPAFNMHLKAPGNNARAVYAIIQRQFIPSDDFKKQFNHIGASAVFYVMKQVIKGYTIPTETCDYVKRKVLREQFLAPLLTPKNIFLFQRYLSHFFKTALRQKGFDKFVNAVTLLNLFGIAEALYGEVIDVEAVSPSLIALNTYEQDDIFIQIISAISLQKLNLENPDTIRKTYTESTLDSVVPWCLRNRELYSFLDTKLKTYQAIKNTLIKQDSSPKSFLAKIQMNPFEELIDEKALDELIPEPFRLPDIIALLKMQIYQLQINHISFKGFRRTLDQNLNITWFPEGMSYSLFIWMNFAYRCKKREEFTNSKPVILPTTAMLFAPQRDDPSVQSMPSLSA